MDQFGLPSQAVEAIRHLLGQNSRIETAIIYGSRAKGNFHNGSDIDLTLVGAHLNLKDLLSLESLVDDLLLPYKLDLSLLAQIEDPALKEHIQRVGQIFYRRVV